MDHDLDAGLVAETLLAGIKLLVRRARAMQIDGDLTLPQRSALSRLDRGGPATSSALAKQEQISPQSMGATLAALEARGMIERHPDPRDGRQVLVSVSVRGRQLLGERRSERTDRMVDLLNSGFTQSELRQLMTAAPLIERLAQSL
jgi:DNA-binding MarR family transcriptional regulator